MEIELEAKPSYGIAVVTMDKGDQLVAEAGSMVAMSKGLAVDTRFNGTGGGFFGMLRAVVTALVRKVVAGETMFVNHFTAESDGQRLMLAPALTGDVERLRMTGDRVVTVQATSFLASGPGVEVSLVWGGFSMLFGGEGAFFLRCEGKGPLLINAYGAIDKVEVDGTFVVDTGHLVAWEGDLEYTIRRAGGWKSTLLSGEGLVLEFKGKGTLFLQTRNLSTLLGWLTPQLPR